MHISPEVMSWINAALMYAAGWLSKLIKNKWCD